MTGGAPWRASSALNVRPSTGRARSILEQPGRGAEEVHAVRVVAIDDRRLSAPVGRQGLERTLAAHEIDVVADRDELLRDAGALVAMVEDHQLVGVGIRQRTEQHRLDDGEYRDVRADTQREREQRGDGEGGLSHQLTERVANEVREHRVQLHWPVIG